MNGKRETQVTLSLAPDAAEVSDMPSGDGSNMWTSTAGFILHILFVAIPKDIVRLLTFRRKNVQGQTVVITGGGSGIGQRMAEMFALDLGANVAIIDVDQEKANATTESIQTRGGQAKAWFCDISNAEAMDACAADIQSTFGRVDIVICNAAILYFGHMLELSTAQLQRAMDVNLMGTIITIRAFLPEMERRNSGQFVAVSSIAGYFGETYGMAYCPAKFAIRGVMECLQMEMCDRGLNGITCTTVCPFFIRTPMILNMGMRPTSRFLPFMSVNRASKEIVDAILKEKSTSFIPFMVGVVVIARNFLAHYMQKAGRSYLNCRYEPTAVRLAQPGLNNNTDYKNGESGERRCMIDSETTHVASNGNAVSRTELTSPENMKTYFKSPPFFWYLIIPPALAFTFITWYKPEWIPVDYLPYLGPFAYKLGTEFSTLVLLINIGALLAHVGEGVYSLYLCDQLQLTHGSAFKWFIQTFILGFPSLRLLLRFKHKTRK